MIKSYYCVHDCETGGLDYKKNPITQYACIILDSFTLKEIDRYETFIKPYDDLQIEKDAIEHTMVTMSDVKSGISVDEFYSTLKKFWEKYQSVGKYKGANRIIPVGHNVTFDHGFLEYVFNREKDSIFNYIHPNIIDTFPLSKLTWGIKGDERLNLTACSERAKIKLINAHGAMNDVEATADLLRYFMRKLRNTKNDVVENKSDKRQLGQKFFEFSCSSK